ncbi:malate dehydrogenase [Halioxenophilus aromaticivorans]|uniref:Lactate/malate dehydrogenase family protein n=1 Tax=Halioxenophilus aromaticivorans TaxID=1306992 RepID=A0AAV3U0R8_9ALTE
MKVTLVGLGHVGKSLAFELATSSFVDELVLMSRNQEAVMGEVLDLRHGQLFVEKPTRIIAGGDEDSAGSDILAICASAPTPPGMKDRMQLAPNNVALLRSLLPPLAGLSPKAKIVMVSNPVDVLVHYALEITGFSPQQVMGTGTLVDSARFRQLLADEINIHMEDIRAYILGEHGDSQFPAMSCADAGGEPLAPTPARYALFEQASKAGFEVLRRKGYTNYAIALAAAKIIECIARDTKHTLPISIAVDGFLGVNEVCLSLPAVVGRGGVEQILHPLLDAKEQADFRHSAELVKKVIDACR